ncbi:MAG: Rid family hydrolase [Myxococcales bacterium]
MENDVSQAQRVSPQARLERSPKSSVAISTLESEVGVESFLTAESAPNLDLAASWKTLESAYHGALRDAGLDLGTEVFMRLHVSDALNQIPLLRDRIPQRRDRGLITLIGQSPLQSNKIALEAYHVKCRGTCRRRLLAEGQLEVEHGQYRTVWGSFHSRATGSAALQTAELLRQLERVAASQGGSLYDNLLRTWFFVRDIDTNYSGLVEARRELFERCGMTAASHYVSSTGIAGEMQQAHELVALDALLEFGLAEGQIRFMTAGSHLCPSHQYGVTFERGTRLTYGDRSHFHISGTASIDRAGHILHPGDLDRQVERTLENIEVLLANEGAHLSDLKQAVVYLRDPSDGARVRTLLASLLPQSVPLIIVEGRVCRPGWLVEIEGIAGTTSGDARFADYFQGSSEGQ